MPADAESTPADRTGPACDRTTVRPQPKKLAMTFARIVAAVAAIAAILAASTAPASARHRGGASAETAEQASVASAAAPVLGAGFVLEGEWLTPGVVSLGWDDVEAATGYELMYRSSGGWVLLSERESTGGAG